jgi:hypothetical protein
MATVIQTHAVKQSVNPQVSISSVKTNTLSKFWQNLETNRFGIIAMLLVVVVCIAGVAAAVAVQRSTFQLLAITLSTMAVEALVLAVMPMRSVFIASVISVVISLLVIIF